MSVPNHNRGVCTGVQHLLRYKARYPCQAVSGQRAETDRPNQGCESIGTRPQTRYVEGCSLRAPWYIVPCMLLTVRPIEALGASYATIQLGHHQLVVT